MSFMRSVSLVVLLSTLPLGAAGLPSDGTIKGALTVDGKKFPLTHIYARKREAWPYDAQNFRMEDFGELKCGVVELIATNVALPEATLAAILQNDYHGSKKIRGVRIVADAGGDRWAWLFLLESGFVRGDGLSQARGDVVGGRSYKGRVTIENEDVTDVRSLDITFDVPVRVQYTRTEAEGAEHIPEPRFAEEFRKAMSGEWKIERWLGLDCTTASGTLTIGERVSPHAFRGTFHIVTSKGDKVEEEVTISTVGTKVHIEGEKVDVPESIWVRDVYDLDFWKDLMIGSNTTDFVVLRRSPT